MAVPKRKTKRERWHNQHALDKVLDSLKKEAKKKLALAEKETSVFADVSVHVIRDCDLRASLPEKALSVHSLAKWTCFVNRAGTLLHIVPREGDGHWRQPLYFPVKKCSEKHVERLVQQYMHGRLT